MSFFSSFPKSLLSFALSCMLFTQQLHCVEAKLTPSIVKAKTQEIMKAHATHKELSPEIAKRMLQNFLEEMDPGRTYLTLPDIEMWLEPSESLIQQLITSYNKESFPLFEEMHESMQNGIIRRRQMELEIHKLAEENRLPKDVKADEFKELSWAETQEDLLNRLIKIRALQEEATEKLDDEELKTNALQLMAKHRTSFEDKYLNKEKKDSLLLSNILKSMAGSLDAHTAYFTPAEAKQFMISVQQRLFGIGAQLRDDLNGFTVMKIIEGGPAAQGGQLQAKDKIIAVNDQPVVGMDITDAVELIRGKENTDVNLRVIRWKEENDEKIEKKLDIVVTRGEVVLNETRLEKKIEPFGDGVIAYLRLHSFYQDPEDSSTSDIERELKAIKEEHNIKGVILDLRNNSGGMLTQAISVTGLFMTKGIVCSIKDHSENVQHLRDLNSKTLWDGPLIVLVNRTSASAAEIVSQTLQDYGRAIVVGDDHTFGKGTFQTFTLNADEGYVNNQGEYKVTRGKYYTVSGKSPQLNGVQSDVHVPGVFSYFDIGEQFAKYPLENDHIEPNFKDNLSDVPWSQRDKIRRLYKFDLQPRLSLYQQHIPTLQKNASLRIEANPDYQAFLKELKDLAGQEDNDQEPDEYGKVDLQLQETFNVMKDLIILL